jgi:hypothetical protein
MSPSSLSEALELSRTNAYRRVEFARAWLYSQLRGGHAADP